MNKELAPIILFVYNRPWHTKKTLKALSANQLAKESILYVFSDGPKDISNHQEMEDIWKVREVASKRKWCKEVIIYENKNNLGLAKSLISGISEIIKKHKRVIVLEDDIITSKYFLKYMNNALDLYENSKRVYTISGYFEPIKVNSSHIFFLTKGTSWGWATWKHRWDGFHQDTIKYIDEIKQKNLKDDFNFSGYPYFDMLNDALGKRIDSWAILYYAFCYLNHGLHLTPFKSLTANIGFDGTGVHCGIENNYQFQKVFNREIILKKIKEEPDLEIPAIIKKWRENTIKTPLLAKIKDYILKMAN